MSDPTAQQPRGGSTLARAAAVLVLLSLLLPGAAAADTLGGQLAVSTGGTPDQAAVAFNQAAGVYEVAWVGNGAVPNLGLLARRFDGAANALGAPFAVLGFPHVHSPALAPAGADFQIFFARDVGSGIAVVGDGLDSDASGSSDAPDYDELPAFAPDASGNALVVWQRSAACFHCASPVPILGQRVDASGAEVGESNFPIAVGSAPDVAYSPASDEWLVAYRVGSAIERVRIEASGAVADPSLTIASGASAGPAVAYNPDRNEYLVVWQGLDVALGKQQIFGRRLDADGDPIGDVIAISEDPAFDYAGAIAPFDGNEFDPDVAYDPSSKQYLVAWTDTFEIYGQHLRGDGGHIGPRAFRISFMGPSRDPSYHAYNPRVAANATAGQWLVTWDGDNPGHQIWARRIAAPVEAPSVSSISPIAKTAGAAPFTLTVNGANFTAASRIEWNGVTRATTFVNAGKLTTTIPAADVALPGNASVRVATPRPGGGASAARTLAIAPSSFAPLNTVLPSISGVAQQGELLSCPSGTWSNAPTALAWRWLRSGAEIGGATGPSLLLEAADVGEAISCRVSAGNAAGTSAAVSDPVVPVEAEIVVPPPAPADSIAEAGQSDSPKTESGPISGEPRARDFAGPRLTVTLGQRRKLRGVLINGLRIPVRCSEPCMLNVRLSVDATTAKRLRLQFETVGRAKRLLKRAGSAHVTVRLTALARKRLKRVRSVRIRIETRAVDTAGNATAARRRLTLTS